MKLPEIVAMITAIIVAGTSIISLVIQNPATIQEPIDNDPAIIVTNNTIKIDNINQNEIRFIFIDNNSTYIIDINKNISRIE